MTAPSPLRRLLSRLRTTKAGLAEGGPQAGGRTAGLLEKRRARPSGPGVRVLAAYRIRNVEYTLYLQGGIPRLSILEPTIEPERLKLITEGLSKPESPTEEYYIEKAKSGYGPLYPLIIDPHVEEIACEGPGREVVVVHKLVPDKWVEVDLILSEDEADSLALQLARKAGKHLSLAVPLAEGLTREGHRVAVTFSREVSRFGSSFTIRKFPHRPITIVDLVGQSVISPLEAAYLWLLLEAKMFILIIGSMGSGKTTLLQALASLIPPFRRVVTIEDTPEIRLPVRHWDALVARPGLPGEDIGEVDLESLLRFSLRRRADYIIVGEVRGREARLLSQAVASGHGGITTFHADSPEAAVTRLLLEPISLPPLFLRSISAIVHIRRMPDYMGGVRRRVVSISEIDGEELVDVFRWDPRADRHLPENPEEILESSSSLKRAWELLGVPHDDLADELRERTRFIEDHLEEDPETFSVSLTTFYSYRYGGSPS